MTPIWEPRFSEHSYGFRPGRKAADAVRAAQGYAERGQDWVVDLDITKFFDRVNWDTLVCVPHLGPLSLQRNPAGSTTPKAGSMAVSAPRSFP
jgi:hypothetical protein